MMIDLSRKRSHVMLFYPVCMLELLVNDEPCRNECQMRPCRIKKVISKTVHNATSYWNFRET